MKKVIVITSGKGGVGKTTTSINLGAALNFFGENVLILDGNLSTPNIGVNLGSPEVPITLNHVLSNKANLSEAIYEHESGVKIIPSSLSIKDLGKKRQLKIKDLKNDLKKYSNYIIVDCSAGLSEETKEAIEVADDLIIVTNPEIAAITDALKTIKIAGDMKKNILGIIVSRVRKDKIEMQPNTVKEMLELPILGMIPEDISIKKATNLKDSVIHTHPKSKSSRAYKEIAAKILKIEYNSKKDRPNFIEIILRKY
jgi:septum site-determining protein MinD